MRLTTDPYQPVGPRAHMHRSAGSGAAAVADKGAVDNMGGHTTWETKAWRSGRQQALGRRMTAFCNVFNAPLLTSHTHGLCCPATPGNAPAQWDWAAVGGRGYRPSFLGRSARPFLMKMVSFYALEKEGANYCAIVGNMHAPRPTRKMENWKNGWKSFQVKTYMLCYAVYAIIGEIGTGDWTRQAKYPCKIRKTIKKRKQFTGQTLRQPKVVLGQHTPAQKMREKVANSATCRWRK